MNTNVALLAALARRPFVPFLLYATNHQLLITDPSEISIEQETVTLILAKDNIHVGPVSENYLIRKEEENNQSFLPRRNRDRLINEEAPVTISHKDLETKPEFEEIRVVLEEQLRKKIESSTKYGFTRLEVSKCPEATDFAQALKLGWFHQIRIGRKTGSSIKNAGQLRAVLEKLQYPYLAEGVVTKKGAEQLVDEWQTALREKNTLQMQKKRARQKKEQNSNTKIASA